MARVHPITMKLPDADQLNDLKRRLKLSDAQNVALQETLKEANSYADEMRQVLSRAEKREALKKVDKLLQNLELGLRRADFVAALAALETYGAIAHLISPSAMTELPGYEECPVSLEALSSLLNRNGGGAIMPSEVDGVLLTDRQRGLNGRTAELMLLLVRQLRRPIQSELNHAKPDKGGNRPKGDRDVLLFLLARDAHRLLGEGAVAAPSGSFLEMCTWVLGECNISTDGIEDALVRCLRKHKSWLEWMALPSLPSAV